MDEEAGTSTRVNIFGEELGIRSQASPEYTRKVAEYVDQAMRQVSKATRLTDVHRIAILAAMSITDEFFQARDAGARTETEWTEKANGILRLLRGDGDPGGEEEGEG
jgi:cell division protein ZapA (FtsZ GTPase activity inhibitor)